MKTVLFVRHAKSSWNDASLDDHDRPLNGRGRRDAPFMAKLISGRGIRPDRILSSSARRAFDTAVFFAEALDIAKRDIEVRPEIYHAYPDDLLALVQGLPNEWSTVMIFGHNPTLTGLVNRFTEEYIPNVPTCAVSQIAAEVDRWRKFDEAHARLVAYYYPKQYFNQ